MTTLEQPPNLELELTKALQKGSFDDIPSDNESRELDKEQHSLKLTASKLTSKLSSTPFIETLYHSTTLPPIRHNSTTPIETEIHLYQQTLQSVHELISKCKQHHIPTKRPHDFFAEMLKSDTHMGAVKDRLILEKKKMEIVEKRRAGKEQGERRKEKRVEELQDRRKKIEKKKELFSTGRRHDNSYGKDKEGRNNNRWGGKGTKRMDNDRKYGYGGKKKRFKGKNLD